MVQSFNTNIPTKKKNNQKKIQSSPYPKVSLEKHQQLKKKKKRKYVSFLCAGFSLPFSIWNRKKNVSLLNKITYIIGQNTTYYNCNTVLTSNVAASIFKKIFKPLPILTEFRYLKYSTSLI